MKKYCIPQFSILTIVALFFLVGCATHQEEAVKLPVESEENELQLKEPESQLSLAEELKELERTGQWDDPALEASLEPAPVSPFDFPVVTNKQVEMYLDLFQGKQRSQFGRWLARSGKYKEMMEEILAEKDLPLDLVYLAMIESGYMPLACSRSKAVGLWQFMKGTGRQYQLRVDSYVDERRDPLKSTRAAANYLADLYQEFDDWHLAVAAYNGGPGKIRHGLRKYKVETFWQLAAHKHLRLETKRYVPKLIAAIMIAKEPEKYGFETVVYQEPLAFDSLSVNPGMPLDAIAMACGSTAKKIRLLNPELRQAKTPINRRSYVVKIPQGTRAMASANMDRLHPVVHTAYKNHLVKKNESLKRICRKYGINKATLLKVNGLTTTSLRPGMTLSIPYSKIRYQLLPEGAKGQPIASDSLVLHRIVPGDTVSKIAKKYQVPPEMIVLWNGLASIHSIRAGQQLALYIDRDGRGATGAIRPDAGRHVAVQTLQKTKTKKLVDKDKPFQYYSVKSGDSLWTISRKFRASTADIKKWNKLKSNLIYPGATLKVKKS